MALYKPSNFYPNMDEVDLEREDGQEFECKIHANGSEVNAYKLTILSEDGIPLYEEYNNLKNPLYNEDFLTVKMMQHKINTTQSYQYLYCKDINYADFNYKQNMTVRTNIAASSIMEFVNNENVEFKLTFFLTAEQFQELENVNSIFICFGNNLNFTNRISILNTKSDKKGSWFNEFNFSNLTKKEQQNQYIDVNENVTIYFKYEEDYDGNLNILVDKMFFEYKMPLSTSSNNIKYCCLNILEDNFGKSEEFESNDNFLNFISNVCFAMNSVNADCIVDDEIKIHFQSSCLEQWLNLQYSSPDMCPYNLYNIKTNNIKQFKVFFYSIGFKEYKGCADIIDFEYDSDNECIKNIKFDNFYFKNQAFYDEYGNLIKSMINVYQYDWKLGLSNDYNYKWTIRLYENKLGDINQTELINNTFLTEGYLTGSTGSNIWYMQQEQYGNANYNKKSSYINNYVEINFNSSNSNFYEKEIKQGFTLTGNFKKIDKNIEYNFDSGSFDINEKHSGSTLMTFTGNTSSGYPLYNTVSFTDINTVKKYKDFFKINDSINNESLIGNMFIEPQTWAVRAIESIDDSNNIKWTNDDLNLLNTLDKKNCKFENGCNFNIDYASQSKGDDWYKKFSETWSGNGDSKKLVELSPQLPVLAGVYSRTGTSFCQYNITLSDNNLLTNRYAFVISLICTRYKSKRYSLLEGSNMAVVVSNNNKSISYSYDLADTLFFDMDTMYTGTHTCITCCLPFNMIEATNGSVSVQLNIKNILYQTSAGPDPDKNNNGKIIAVGLVPLDVNKGGLRLDENCVNILPYIDNVRINYNYNNKEYSGLIEEYSPNSQGIRLKDKNQQIQLIDTIKNNSNEDETVYSNIKYSIGYNFRTKILEHNKNLGTNNDFSQLILEKDMPFKINNNNNNNTSIYIYDCDNKITTSSVCLNKQVTSKFKIGDYIRFPRLDGVGLLANDNNVKEDVFKKENRENILHCIIGFDNDSGETRFDNELNITVDDSELFEIWEKIINSADLESAYYKRIYPECTYELTVDSNGKVIDTEMDKKMIQYLPTIRGDYINMEYIYHSTNLNLFVQPNINMLADKFYMPQIQFDKSVYNFKYFFDQKRQEDISFNKLSNSQWLTTLIEPVENLNNLDWYKIYMGFVDSGVENYFYARDRVELTVKATSVFLEKDKGWNDLSTEKEITIVSNYVDFKFVGTLINKTVNIKRYRYQLYEQETGMLLFDTNYLYDDKLQCFVQGLLLNQHKYSLILELETDLGLIYKQCYNMKVSCNPYTSTKFNQLSIVTNDKCICINCKHSNTIDAMLYKYSNVDKKMEFISEIKNQKNVNIFDYNIRNNENYNYMIMCKEITNSNIYGINLGSIKTCFDSYVITDIYKIKDGFYGVGESWKLKYNLDSNDITSNLSVTKHDTLGKYGMVTYGKRNYDSSNITCLLGDIKNDKYTEVENSNNILKLTRWKEFISNGNLKLLRDLKGNKWIVNTIDNPTIKFDSRTNNLMTTISFSWVEVMSSDNISIVDIQPVDDKNIN